MKSAKPEEIEAAREKLAEAIRSHGNACGRYVLLLTKASAASMEKTYRACMLAAEELARVSSSGVPKGKR